MPSLLGIYSDMHDYWKEFSERIVEERGNDPLPKEPMFKWIRHWGNGGGMSSIEHTIKEKLESDDINTFEDFIGVIEGDSYFETATAVLFRDILECMFHDVDKGDE